MWILLLIIGILNLAAPEFMWQIGEGWKFKDAEPSEAAILMGRVVGGICIIISIVKLLC